MNKYILFIIIFVILTTLSLNYSGGCDILFEFVDSRCIGQMGWPFAYYIFYEVRGEYFDQLKFFLDILLAGIVSAAVALVVKRIRKSLVRKV